MNVIEFLKEHNIEFRQLGEHHHCTQGFVQVDCPKCSPKSGKFRLGWNLNQSYFSCWVCSGIGALWGWSQLLGKPWRETHELIKDFWSPGDDKPRGLVPPGRFVTPPNLVELMPYHKTYLREKRGFTDNEIDKLVNTWGIRGFNGLSARFTFGIYIPIVYDGALISYTVRMSGEETGRYISASKNDEMFSHKDILYGVDYCQHSIMLVEGPLDVWKIGPGAAATFGIQYTRAQLLMASRFRNRFICFDNEPQAQKQAMRLAYELSPFPGSTYICTLDSKDPGEATERELKQLRSLIT